MMDPTLDQLMTKVDCRYTLAVEAAKRARQLVDGARTLSPYKGEKAVTVAVHEIFEEQITYNREEE